MKSNFIIPPSLSSFSLVTQFLLLSTITVFLGCSDSNKKPIDRVETQQTDSNEKPIDRVETQQTDSNEKPIDRVETQQTDSNEKPIDRVETQQTDSNEKPIDRVETQQTTAQNQNPSDQDHNLMQQKPIQATSMPAAPIQITISPKIHSSIPETPTDQIPTEFLSIRYSLKRLESDVMRFMNGRDFMSSDISCQSEIKAIHDRLSVPIYKINYYGIYDLSSYNRDMVDDWTVDFMVSQHKWQLCHFQKLLEQTPQESPQDQYIQEFVNFKEGVVEFINSEVFTNSYCQESTRSMLIEDRFFNSKFLTLLRYSLVELTINSAINRANKGITGENEKFDYAEFDDVDDLEKNFDQIKSQWRNCNFNRLNREIDILLDRRTDHKVVRTIRQVAVNNHSNMECINQLGSDLSSANITRGEVPIAELKEKWSQVCEIRD